MTVTVPSTDVPNYNLQTSITTLTAAITAAASNGPLAFALTKQQVSQQMELVLGLLGSGALVPATVLSTMTYVTPTPTAGGSL